MRNSKLQSAMEYLMTYGWAILVIAVVLGVLFQLGVFSASSFSIRAPSGACQVLRTSAVVNLVGQCSGLLPRYVAQFNGATSYITVGTAYPFAANSITYVAWINPGNYMVSPGWEGTGIVGWQSVSPTTLLFRASGGGDRVCMDIRDPVTGLEGVLSNSLVSYGQWHMVAGTYQTGMTTAYLDGVANSMVTAKTPGSPASTVLIGMAGWGGPNNFYFNGMITNVQIYNTSLSSNDLSDLYAEGIGGAPIKIRNLIGWWPLNGDTKDYSGNGNTGVPTAVSYLTQYGK
jgi:hypothetical protein